MSAKMYLSNGNDLVASQALIKRTVDRFFVDLDGLAHDLGISEESWIRHRDVVVADLDKCATKGPLGRVWFKCLDIRGIGARKRMICDLARAKALMERMRTCPSLFEELGTGTPRPIADHA